MKREEILDVLIGLAASTGLYGRILMSINEMPDDEREEFFCQLESMNFATDLEVVLFFEEGKLPAGYVKPEDEQEEDEETPQVRLTITTDLYYTAEFLRELATAIEDGLTDLTDFETYRGAASIEWPEEAYEEE